MNVKKVWLTSHESDLCSLSIESEGKEKWNQIHTSSDTFPANPTPENPARHVTVLSLFDTEDLLKIRNAIDKKLGIED